MTAWLERSSKVLLESPWLKVSCKSFELDNGATIPEYYIIEKQDSAMAICYLEDEDRFILVRQYRPGVGKPTTCHPGGLLDATDASPLKGALRELLEETGYQAYKTVHLGSFAPAPAFWVNHVHMYLVYCRSVTRTAATPEPTEDLEIVSIARTDLLSLVNSGEMDCIPCSLGSYRALEVLAQDSTAVLSRNN
jgi:8-oxo-dGTP pyrophosphatase MutT (NUDIX family)